jgi:hypothetical protein
MAVEYDPKRQYVLMDDDGQEKVFDRAWVLKARLREKYPPGEYAITCTRTWFDPPNGVGVRCVEVEAALKKQVSPGSADYVVIANEVAFNEIHKKKDVEAAVTMAYGRLAAHLGLTSEEMAIEDEDHDLREREMNPDMSPVVKLSDGAVAEVKRLVKSAMKNNAFVSARGTLLERVSDGEKAAAGALFDEMVEKEKAEAAA